MNQLIRFIRAQGPLGRGRFSSCLPALSLTPHPSPLTPQTRTAPPRPGGLRPGRASENSISD